MLASVLALTGAGAVVLLVLFTTRRPEVVLASRSQRLARWQTQHHAPGIDPEANPFVRGFLRVADFGARPLARRGVAPNALTLLAVWGALWVPVLARARHLWPLLGAVVVVLSALADGLDGSVAAMTDRSTQLGFVLDSVADRIADSAFTVALVLAGAKGWWGGAAGVSMGLLEYTRARASAGGFREVGVITVGERPTRIVAATIGLGACGLAPHSTRFIATGTLVVITVTSLIGLAQLAAVLARRLDR